MRGRGTIRPARARGSAEPRRFDGGRVEVLFTRLKRGRLVTARNHFCRDESGRKGEAGETNDNGSSFVRRGGRPLASRRRSRGMSPAWRRFLRGTWPAPGSAGVAPGRLLRLFLSATSLRPPLRSFFSYSGGWRSVVEGEGRSRRRSSGRVPGARRGDAAGILPGGSPLLIVWPWRGGWDSWGESGRGRVRICCKGAPDRDRPQAEARNIDDSLRVPRLNPGLCNRFGQTASPRPRGRRGVAGRMMFAWSASARSWAGSRGVARRNAGRGGTAESTPPGRRTMRITTPTRPGTPRRPREKDLPCPMRADHHHIAHRKYNQTPAE